MSDTTEQNDPPMSLVAHLTELRDRLLRAVLAVLIGFIVLFPFANEIYGFVSAPLRDLMPEGSTMIATGVASPFLTPFQAQPGAGHFYGNPGDPLSNLGVCSARAL